MNYFAIEYDNGAVWSKKGEPQVDQVEHHCHVFDDPNFIDKFPFQFIENTPILSFPIVQDSFELTDLIRVSSMGFSYGSMVMSDRLKSIFEKFNLYGLQFFKTKVIKSGKYYNDYWQTHIYECPLNRIDFRESRILFTDRDEKRRKHYQVLRVDNLTSFLSIAKELKYPQQLIIDEAKFVDDINLDYLHLRYFPNGGTRGMVS